MKLLKVNSPTDSARSQQYPEKHRNLVWECGVMPAAWGDGFVAVWNRSKPKESRKSALDSGDRGGEREKRNVEKNAGGGRSDDEGKSRDRRKEERSSDERRPKREREESPAKKERHRERRFREVKERESPRERDSPRERNWRPPSERPRWSAEERSKFYKDQDLDKGTTRGGYRGGRRSFSGGSRQSGSFAGNQGRYNAGGERDSRQGNWGGDRHNGGDRDSSYRRQPLSYQSKGDRWQHDLFKTVVNVGNSEELEEDPVAKIEALLAS
ncbi:hypothetical protein AXG93_1080s1080 [Marchantia polymorpha subsp. ruderalis]|uniref:Uncharacterized protein n=1 Tax=Marchantia polymorpha subsp. ruderalis TaxID=1480154 RepID=A0A176W590_MARPO|nr:hypothetical protein AXG93_1080s1080 [Marchantia polymorpha subsp. ruderalis]